MNIPNEPQIVLPNVEEKNCITLPSNTVNIPGVPGGTGGRILDTQQSEDILLQSGNTILLQ